MENSDSESEEEEEAEVDSSDEEAERLEKERFAFGTKFVKTSKDNSQPVKSLEWTLVDHTKLPVNCERERVPGANGTKYPAQLLNQKGAVDSIYKHWKHFCPPTWLGKFVRSANTSGVLLDSPVDKNYRKTSEAEIEALLGETLAAAVTSVGSFDTCFAVLKNEESLFPPGGFGQYGITKNRALTLIRAMHLSAGPEKPAGELDTHWFIDGPLEEFNEHMMGHFRSSYLFTMDETGPKWNGLEGEDDFNKCPHVSFVPRKPEPVCAEFNDSACALSRVMVRMEYEKALKYHAAEQYVPELGYNAAMATRLAAPVRYSNAAVYGDSRFASVKALFSIWKRFKVHSAWDVKTGTALYPRKEIQRMCAKEHGSIVVMQAEIEDRLMYAVGQRRGPSVHTFLTSFGTFIKEVPKRWPHITSIANAPWTTPSILNTVTEMQPAIDTFNRQLFDLMGMQYTFKTRCFETRLSQHFFMPVTYINAVNAAKYFMPQLYGKQGTKEMLMALATAMVHNPTLACDPQHRPVCRWDGSARVEPQRPALPADHQLAPGPHRRWTPLPRVASQARAHPAQPASGLQGQQAAALLGV